MADQPRSTDDRRRQTANADPGAQDDRPFWQRKTLREMTDAEWESLCDGCGRCCLVKLEEDLGDSPSPEAAAGAKIFYTDVGCRLLDGHSCRCTDYPNRFTAVPDCLRIDAKTVEEAGWLPVTCAYRLLDEGKDLKWWHPLISGTPQSVIDAGISVSGRLAAAEDEVADAELENHIVSWPMRWPRAAKSVTPPPLARAFRKTAVKR